MPVYRFSSEVGCQRGWRDGAKTWKVDAHAWAFQDGCGHRCVPVGSVAFGNQADGERIVGQVVVSQSDLMLCVLLLRRQGGSQFPQTPPHPMIFRRGSEEIASAGQRAFASDNPMHEKLLALKPTIKRDTASACEIAGTGSFSPLLRVDQMRFAVLAK